MTAPSHSDLQRALGQLEGTYSAMETRMGRIEQLITDGFANVSKDIASMRAEHKAELTAMRAEQDAHAETQDRRIRAIEDRDNQQQGAWKVIVIVSAIVSLVISVGVPAVISWLSGL